MSLNARYQDALDRYADNLSNPKQRGEGAHSFIMSTANRGTIAGLPVQQIYDDLRRILTSKVSDHPLFPVPHTITHKYHNSQD